jgi:hypothetical protein
LQKGIEQAADNPVARASLWHEMARLALSESALKSELDNREKGNDIYRSIGLRRRIAHQQVTEYGFRWDGRDD